MANTTFNGPVRSLHGFEMATKNATTGTVTTRMSSGMPDLTGLLFADTATGANITIADGVIASVNYTGAAACAVALPAATSGAIAVYVQSKDTAGGVNTLTFDAIGSDVWQTGSLIESRAAAEVTYDTSAAGGTQEYAQINTDLTTTDTTGWDSVYLINQQVGGTSKFRVTSTGAATFASTVTSSNGISGLWCASGNSNVSYRGNTVDYWYVGNQSLGDAITIGDFGTYKFSSAMFTAHHSVQLQAWNLTTTFSSAHDFEVEMWDIEVSAGGSFATSVTKIGATQSVTATALKIYSIGQVGLDYTLAAGHLLFMPIRYTDGSGTFYTYGTVGMEFTNA